MRVTTDRCAAGYTLRIEGRFDFMLYDSFQEAYSRLTPDSTRVSVDLSQTEYLDSCALGMLLMLRSHFDSTAEIRLINPRPQVASVLVIAKFDKLFRLQSNVHEVDKSAVRDECSLPAIVRQPQSESQ